MNKKDITQYFNSWKNPKHSHSDNLSSFFQMLQSKTLFANSNNTKIKAFKKLRTGNELNKMIDLADKYLI